MSLLAQGLKHFTDVPLSVVGMLVFIVTFSAISVWTLFRVHSKEFYQKIARLPLGKE